MKSNPKSVVQIECFFPSKTKKNNNNKSKNKAPNPQLLLHVHGSWIAKPCDADPSAVRGGQALSASHRGV